MKLPPHLVPCYECDKEMDIKKLYKFTWRYTDKKKTYAHSGRGFIMTGYKYLCTKCLKKIIK